MAGKRDLRQLPELEGWVTFPDAAEDLGISRQRLHQVAERDDPPVIETARRIGRRHVIFVMRAAEVADLKRRREESGGQPWSDL